MARHVICSLRYFKRVGNGQSHHRLPRNRQSRQRLSWPHRDILTEYACLNFMRRRQPLRRRPRAYGLNAFDIYCEHETVLARSARLSVSHRMISSARTHGDDALRSRRRYKLARYPPSIHLYKIRVLLQYFRRHAALMPLSIWQAVKSFAMHYHDNARFFAGSRIDKNTAAYISAYELVTTANSHAFTNINR